jgi:hypothetical protein
MDPMLASMDNLPLTEMWMDNDETVPVEGYKCITKFNDRMSELEE